MKMLRKILIVNIVFALVLSSVACGETQTTSAGEAQQNSQVENQNNAESVGSSENINNSEDMSEQSQAQESSGETTSQNENTATESTQTSEQSVSSETVQEQTEPMAVEIIENEGEVTFVFSRLPVSAEDISTLPVENMQMPEFAAAMYVAAMCSYESNIEASFEMWDYLNGPEDISSYDESFIKERLTDKIYKVYSYFAGSSPENDYTPTEPYTITIMENPYTYADDGYARVLVQSSGADSERFITVRLKDSTGEWFFWEQALFADIRVPQSQDAWS